MFALFFMLPSVRAGVVINEIFYHAPDDLDDLEFIELFNASTNAVDLSGWKFTQGIKFEFPERSRILPGAYLVLCRNAATFARYYSAPVAGRFKQKLSNSGESLELRDATGNIVDSVSYTDSAPWPLGPDGESASLERICPDAPGNDPANWSSSPLSANRDRPGGSPGQINASFLSELPPRISGVKLSPEHPAPDQPLQVEATVTGADESAHVILLYQTLASIDDSFETAVPMKEISPGHFSAAIPPVKADRLLRYRIGVRTASGATRFHPGQNEPRPALSVWISAPPKFGRIPLARILAPPGTEQSFPSQRWRGPRRFEDNNEPPAPARSALIYFDPAQPEPEVFDFVQVSSRTGGWKVHLGKGQSLREMTTLNIVFETEAGTLAEPLAYELYRLCGMAAEQSWHVRLTINDQLLGYHLLFEQPNKAFLRRNHLRDDGNLYKILWYEQGVVRQHEKKTNTREGHDDIVALVRALQSTRGDAQWEVIQKNFDVPQVATYFAVNMVLSHWDGFFNNYFTYHDLNGSGKWTMYPWDQDQTWGIQNHNRDGSVFFTMPLTFGMEGDAPPGQRPGFNRGGRFMFGGGPGAGWWRPGGYFSAPLLANPQFRKIFLARTREILEQIYTPEKILPLIDALDTNLRDEVKLRADRLGGDASWELRQFDLQIRAFRTHLAKRREFLLAQPELQNIRPGSE